MKVGKERIFYLMEGVDINMSICQYLKLEYLYNLLDSQSYFLKRKQFFEDMAEKMPPMRNVFSMFTPHVVGTNHINTKKYQEEKKNLYELINQLEYAKSLPTSCWTKRIDENYLMWKSYAPENGVCIKSTIHNFIASFTSCEYRIICGKMSYNNYRGLRTIDDYLFSKHSFYSNEEEIRFYFDKQNYNEHKQLEKAVYIKVDPTVLIDKIILSPLMDNKKVDEVITRIRNNFNFEIKKSSISLKNG